MLAAAAFMRRDGMIVGFGDLGHRAHQQLKLRRQAAELVLTRQGTLEEK